MLVWEGQTNREIANVVGTTEQVIKNYLRNTFDKLGVWSRLELALYVAAHGGAHWRGPAGLPPVPVSVSSTVQIPHPLQPSADGSPAPAADNNNDQGSRRSTYRPKVSPRLISA